jgi:hypothetical protein
VQKSDEKWRVTQRRESAANVRNKNDEKDDNVSFASPELIGPDNRPKIMAAPVVPIILD